MKILAIRIKNLASLEDLTEIDFTQEPLCSAGIFAITGPTGAGKSTILDALCLALYAKTPRYKQAESGIEIHDVQGSTISQSDARGILRDGTAEGFAEVDFVGVDAQHYRATWSVRRARNKAEGSLQAFTVVLKNISANADVPGKKTELLDEIERLVGLNFEQFTRSVLLAQGDFTAFLKAGKDEKSSLLEKLTGTHIYSEISKRVFEKHKEEAQELRDINLQREGILTLTAEELDALGAQQSALSITIATRQQQEGALSKEIVWHEQLAVLQTSVTSAGTASEQAIAVKGNARPREQKLKQVEQVQPARTWTDGLHTVKEQAANKTATVQKLEAALLVLQKQEVAMELLVQHADTELANKSKASEAAEPLLNEAKALDVQVKERAEQVVSAAEEVQHAGESSKQQEQQLQEKQQQSNELQKSIGQLTQWKAKNESRQPIADNHSLIVSKLSDARKLLDALQSGALQVTKIQEAIAGKGAEKADLDKQLTATQTTLQASRQAYDEKLEALAGIVIADLEKDKSNTDSMVEETIAAEGHWKVLYHALQEQGNITATLAVNKKELDSRQQQLIKKVEELSSAKASRETSLRMVERARLAAAENVETLRSQLVNGDPCPVCGSTEHPYALHNPQLDHVLADLEKTHQQYETAYTDCLAANSSLQEACHQLQKAIGTQEAELVSKGTALLDLQAIWTGFTLYKESAALSDEQKAGWLTQQLQEKRTIQKKLQGSIQAYHTQKQQLESQKSQLDQAEKKLTDISNAIKDAARDLQSFLEQLELHTQEQEKANAGLAEVAQTLSPWFTTEDWLGQWKKSPGPFAKRITDFAEEWKTNTHQLEENSRQQDILLATIKEVQEQWTRLVADAGKKQQLLSGLKDQHHELTGKRKAIFGGELVSKVEAALKQAIDVARQTLEKHKADKEKLQTNITRTVTQKEQAEKDIVTLQEQANGFMLSIQEWVIAYNVKYASALQESELAGLLSLTTAWMEEERAALRAMDDAVMQAQSVLTERKALLEKHEQQRLSEKSLDELNLLQTETKAELQKATQENNDIAFRLRQDKSNKQQIGDLLKTIEAKAGIVENWAKLNEIIGSADGKKFRQIAQEYTLDILLSYANVHLEMLSKRYLLQRIPHSLGLQVLDQDMGDEIRTVYSLSGGESFLVSLALALGLASLSSSRMKVESLFIDEGFGSLDPTTLNIAMDALERLHNQGRKVGVISHVQEMTERIPVQIKVSKKNTGRSMVEIIA